MEGGLQWGAMDRGPGGAGEDHVEAGTPQDEAARPDYARAAHPLPEEGGVLSPREDRDRAGAGECRDGEPSLSPDAAALLGGGAPVRVEGQGQTPLQAAPGGGAKGRGAAEGYAALDMGQGLGQAEAGGFLRRPGALLGAVLFAGLVGAAIAAVAYARPFWHASPSLPVCALPPNLRLASGASGAWGRARAQAKLRKPLVILLSSDGFRVDYFLKLPKDSHILRLREEATWATDGMLPPFPSVTFPSHYSMATGLHPAWHGIVDNVFRDPRNTSATFNPGVTDPAWWLGEPIWETVTKQGLVAATMFWPGANVEKGPWDCPPSRCFKEYNASIPYDQRVDTVLEWVALPESQRPSLITLYFEEPDHSGHQGGPDTPLITHALARVDAAVGRLLAGLQSMGVEEDVNLILVSDHGMLSSCGERTVYLADLAPHVTGFDRSWVTFDSSFVGFLPPPEVDVGAAYAEMSRALGKMRNGDQLSLWRKEDLPPRFLLASSARIPPIVGVVAEGWVAPYDDQDWRSGRCLGQHGFDNQLASMRAIFLGRGPRFAPGRSIPTLMNVEVYNIVTSILGISPAPNNGTAGLPDFVLLPL